ncbi:MAG: hypothetical protein LBE85_04265 [Candidatus Accumulibacter sp.]|jgi:hypothetical protein|nr:hypothetical protein [Accumulibacter sp.]
MKKQNCFADLEDALDDENLWWALAILLNLVAFLVIWACTGPFWGSLILTLVSSWFFGGVPVFLLAVVSAIFARRDYDA